ncbi:S-adenosyl-L-methionine-dependent methyltransferase [Mycobacteroides abscessus]|nr:S-adenosyl-L-methionine-dependent methyltransferase [Mycobacteroides abscessus]
MTRTDGDQWDIVSSVGFTALMVSSFRALETTRTEPLIRDEYAHAFVEASGEPRLTEALAAGTPESEWDTATVYLVNHLAVRTKYFDEFFAAATGSGIQQVVILAAGLDSRVYRLPWPDGTVVYELDQPKVLEFKDHVLREEHAVPLAERREVAVDLRDDWIAALGGRASTPLNPLPGSPRVCWRICPELPRTRCSRTSPLTPHPAASLPPNGAGGKRPLVNGRTP